jgi:hypothetical protein
MKKNVSNMLAVILIIILIFVVIIINIVSTLNNVSVHDYNNDTNGTFEKFNDVIYIEGEEETINVAKYNSHLGFSINYDVDLFSLNVKNDSRIIISFKEDNTIYLSIEKLEKNDYLELYKKESISKEVDNYMYNYTYLRNNNSYYRLTTVVPNNSEYEDLYIRLNYMIDSFTID